MSSYVYYVVVPCAAVIVIISVIQVIRRRQQMRAMHAAQMHANIQMQQMHQMPVVAIAQPVDYRRQEEALAQQQAGYPYQPANPANAAYGNPPPPAQYGSPPPAAQYGGYGQQPAQPYAAYPSAYPSHDSNVPVWNQQPPPVYGSAGVYGAMPPPADLPAPFPGTAPASGYPPSKQDPYPPRSDYGGV
eukprot:TRINITY_DN5116_c0_g1_i1.p1 TRINITY_DN5116_c0_g1~~TRINITY_DN5116_c0_g1_i1.p1  ORF type:complete len:188 (-),score=33.66 TRINITY_DN5116_c0_g1_i1:79-642(-)